MPRRKYLGGLTAVLVAPLLGGLAVEPSVAVTTGATTLPTCPATTLTKTGNQTSAVSGTNNGGTWDLTGAVWDEVAPSPIAYPVRSDAWTKGCLIGARVNGNVPKDATRDQWYDGEDGGTRRGGEAFRQTLTNTSGNYLVLRNTYAEDYEDAYDPNGSGASHTLYLDHVQAKYIRDDCIENEGGGSPDAPMNVVVRNSLFDGCFTGFAQRPKDAGGAVQNGSGSQFLDVENSLMYIQPQPLGPNYCSSDRVSTGRCKTTSKRDVWLGAHGIWKWSKAAARTVNIRNTVFKLDMASYSSCSSQVWPDGNYENVTLVWAGAGDYRKAGGCTNTLPDGVKLTTDTSVWDKAKAAWLAGDNTAPSTPDSRIATQATASATRDRVAGTLATVSGQRVVGAAMTLERRLTGSDRWVERRRVRTDSTGAVNVTVDPPRTAYFRWVFKGGPVRAGDVSPAVRVRR